MDAVAAQHDPLSVDPLMGVLGEEQVVGPSAHQGAQQHQAARAEVLRFVDEDVVGESCRLRV